VKVTVCFFFPVVSKELSVLQDSMGSGEGPLFLICYILHLPIRLMICFGDEFIFGSFAITITIPSPSPSRL
jgi:hypothetical protein